MVRSGSFTSTEPEHVRCRVKEHYSASQRAGAGNAQAKSRPIQRGQILVALRNQQHPAKSAKQVLSRLMMLSA